MASILFQVLAIVFLFLSGSIYPVINNTILTYNFPYKDITLQFQQPWFQSLVCFFGMSFFLIPSLIFTRCKDDINKSSSGLSVFRTSSIPSILGVFSMVLQTYGLIYMPVHIWQIFNEFYLLFSSLFSIIYGQKKLQFTDWVGLFFVVLGISFAGVSSLTRSISAKTELTTELFFSFILQILGHCLKAFVELGEETLMESSLPVTVTAYEGIWGFYVISLIILPCMNITKTNLIILHEHTPDILTFLKSSKFLIGLELFLIIAFSVYRFCQIYLLKAHKQVRSISESFLPITVWFFSFIEYKIQKHPSKQFFDKYSYIEIAGLFITLFGSLMYHKLIRLPCFVYSKDSDANSRNTQMIANDYILD